MEIALAQQRQMHEAQIQSQVQAAMQIEEAKQADMKRQHDQVILDMQAQMSAVGTAPPMPNQGAGTSLIAAQNLLSAHAAQVDQAAHDAQVHDAQIAQAAQTAQAQAQMEANLAPPAAQQPAQMPEGTVYLINSYQHIDLSALTGTFDGACKRNGQDCDTKGDSLCITAWGGTLALAGDTEIGNTGQIIKKGTIIWKGHGPAGTDCTRGTNNEAEYTSIVKVIDAAVALSCMDLHMKGDSKIGVGTWHSRETPPTERLVEIAHQSQHHKLVQFEIEWVQRKLNREADALCNEACTHIMDRLVADGDPRLNVANTPHGQTPAVIWARTGSAAMVQCRMQNGSVMWQSGPHAIAHGTAAELDYRAAIVAANAANEKGLGHCNFLFPNALQLNHLNGTYECKKPALQALLAELTDAIYNERRGTDTCTGKLMDPKDSNYVNLQNLKKQICGAE